MKSMMEKNKRVCAELPLDLVKPIASLLIDDVVAYMSFRAVCRHWRSLTDPLPRSLASKFRPRDWIMLIDGLDDVAKSSAPHHFFNLMTGQSLIFHLSELAIYSIFSFCDGLIVLLDKENSIIRLFNPFTCQMSDNFPPLLPQYGFTKDMHQLSTQQFKLAPISSDHCPTLMLYSHEQCYSAKPGGKRWQQIWLGLVYTDHPLILKNFRNYHINIVHRNCISWHKPGENFFYDVIHLWCHAYDTSPTSLVNLGSDLLVVRRIGEIIAKTFEVYRIDFCSRSRVKLDNLGDFAIFIGLDRQAFVVPTINLPSIRSNSIYCFMSSQNTLVANYSLHDNSFELLSNTNYEASNRPFMLATYLYNYCSMLAATVNKSIPLPLS